MVGLLSLIHTRSIDHGSYVIEPESPKFSTMEYAGFASPNLPGSTVSREARPFPACQFGSCEMAARRTPMAKDPRARACCGAHSGTASKRSA